MRNILIGILLFFCTLANCQDSLNRTLSSAVCNCLSKTKNLEDDSFGDCLMQSFQNNNAFLMDMCYKMYKDTSEKVAKQFGLNIYRKISVSMVFSCDLYYRLMDSLRNQSLNYITIDSAKSRIAVIEKGSSNKLNSELFTLRGIIEFKTGEFSAAIQYFDKALSIDSNNYQSKFLKAWSLEKNQNFSEAIIAYKNLADITGRYDFNIFSALAERKKNGL